MADDLPARRQKKFWQVVEQNQTDGRGLLTRCGSCQPKPCVELRHTAQSAKRGCQRIRRSRAVTRTGSDMVRPHHAATARPEPFASAMRARMAGRLNFRLSIAEAW